ncbi:MAG: DUF3048 domain-containing protein [Lachnospiraceae bacterium]|nr:DUF3048 domain-containing protein [Lachnospiraceae bacterium]
MKAKNLAALVLAVGLLAGCGAKEEVDIPVYEVEPKPLQTQVEETPSTSEEETEATEETEEIVAEDLIITERKVVDGKMQSYLTGEWKDAEVASRRNMAVMMPNNKAAMPQYGISKASIIYEAPVEGRVSRLVCLLEDYDDLEYIGPVRSSRDYFLYESMAYDSIYCNWGLARPFVEELINSDRVDNVSQAVAGINKPAAEAFDRISRPGYATEYTGYMYIDGYEKAVKRLGYETEYRDTFEQAFTFANDGHRAEYEDADSATLIYPGGKESNRGGFSDAKSYFAYDEKDGLYYRYQFGGAHIDEMNNEQLTFSNVVFKVCHGEVREPSNLDYLAFGVHGEGDAYVFTAGKVIKGTWERKSDYAANMFYDEDGNEIVFNQGKTWVCIIWDDYEEYIYYE